jgi:glyceraldehyde-3-phosphate dehydrogenase (NAD(P))
MSEDRVRVGVNGYGVIGKRVADAIRLQEDMDLVGVADVGFDYRVKMAVERGYPVFASVADRRPGMEAAGIPVAGELAELLAAVDVVVDCTPKGVGAANMAAYGAADVKAIFQGGESHDLTGYSFVAQVNYEGAVGRQFVRVVSCNTTGMSRVLHALERRDWVDRARIVVMRRGTDPWESHNTGMINTVIPEIRVPSHQGPDAQKVLPDVDLTTMAASGPYNLSHIHFAMVETKHPVSVAELRDAFFDEPRVALIRASDGLVALNTVIELMRDLDRPRGDMWEVAIWDDALASDSREVYLTYQVHKEAIVVPENIDAIRALAGRPDAAASIETTNKSLGITTAFLPATEPVVEHVSGETVEHPGMDAVRAGHAVFASMGMKRGRGTRRPRNWSRRPGTRLTAGGWRWRSSVSWMFS